LKGNHVHSAAALGRITGATDYAVLQQADIVVEAATENIELKLRILRQVDGLVGPDTIVATHTSSISITQLAAVVQNPQRFIGMHFFNPVRCLGNARRNDPRHQGARVCSHRLVGFFYLERNIVVHVVEAAR
jgi:hypothetical protein